MSLHHPHRTRPFKGLSAFGDTGDDRAMSQAATLLSFGNQIRGGAAPAQARAAALGRKAFVGDEPEAGFPVPRLKGLGQHFSFDDSRARLLRLHDYDVRARSVAVDQVDRYSNALSKSAERVFAKPQAANAADLFALSLDHPQELVRIAAAIASLPLTTRPAQNMKILVDGLKREDELERTLAATGLARAYPEHPALRRLSRGRTAARVRRPAQTLMLIHGTWASAEAWYQPRGDFFEYIRTMRADLYAAMDRFKWTGAWSDGARSEAAVALALWVNKHGESGLDLIGHSHGANVMLKATNLGLTMGKAILLSCPVHVDKYFPDFSKLRAPVCSVRVHMDLVILADGGGQRFNHPAIQEIVLPLWFDHSATHDPGVWQKYKLAQKTAL